MSEGAQERKGEFLRGMLIAGIFISGWLFLGNLFKVAPKPPPTAATCWDNSAGFASIAARDEVRTHLKSPRTAKFPWPEHRVADRGDCTYLIVSFVDAENGFGATIRTHYTAMVKITGKYTADVELLSLEQR